jgi:uncharacterized damage-inducible protein DinB
MASQLKLQAVTTEPYITTGRRATDNEVQKRQVVEKSFLMMLVEYNRWATGKIVLRAEELSADEYNQVHPGVAYGSIHGCLVHVAGGETAWLPRWKNETPGPRLTAEDLPTLEAVKAQLDKIEAEQISYIQNASDADLSKEAALPGQPPAKVKPANYLIAHTIFHSMQFRAEAAVALTALGHSPGGLDMAAFLQEYAG